MSVKFPLQQSSSQSAVVCYRGPGCSTFPIPAGSATVNVATFAQASERGLDDFSRDCQTFDVADLSETPFGDLTTGGSSSHGILKMCSGITEETVNCPDDSVWLVNMKGPDGTLMVDVHFPGLVATPTCVGSVQVISGDCEWYGTGVECSGTDTSIASIPAPEICCGDLVDPIQTQCVKDDDYRPTFTYDGSECRHNGPPTGFKSDPNCNVFTRANSNLPRISIPSDIPGWKLHKSCTTYESDESPPSPTASPPSTHLPTKVPTQESDVEASTSSPTLLSTTATANNRPTAANDTPSMGPSLKSGSNMQQPTHVSHKLLFVGFLLGCAALAI